MGSKAVWIAMWVTLAYWLGGAWGCASRQGELDEQNYKVLEEDRPMFDTEPGPHDFGDPANRRGAVEEAAGDTVAARDDAAAVMEAEAGSDVEAAEPEVSGSGAIAGEAGEEGAALTSDEEAGGEADGTEAAMADDATLTDDVPQQAPVVIVDETAEPYRTVAGDPVPPGAVAVVETQPSLRGLDRSHWSRTIVMPARGTTHHGPIYFSDVSMGWRDPQITRMMDEGAAPDAWLLPALDGTEAQTFTGTSTLEGVVQPVHFGLDMALLPIRMIIQPPWSDATTP